MSSSFYPYGTAVGDISTMKYNYDNGYGLPINLSPAFPFFNAQMGLLYVSYLIIREILE
jgi:hypothetical protein